MGQQREAYRVRIFILSGERGAGKTSFCLSIIREARKQGMSVTGIVTLTERDKRLTARDLFTGAERTLAESDPAFLQQEYPRTHGRAMKQSGMTSPRTHGRAMKQSGMTSPRTGRWIFNEETLIQGNAALKKPEPSDLFILDEAGILELERNQGWTEGIKRTDRMIDRTIIVVVRPELTEKALKRWPGALVLTISPENRPQEEKLIETILQNP
jgi:nucleoside-triphosphatase THEP1